MTALLKLGQVMKKMRDTKKFINRWANHGYEKGEAQTFWLSLLRDVLAVDDPENFINFEVPVPQGFIDGFLPDTKTLIEQKSSSVNLDDPEIFLQAKRYNDALEYSRKARWIITCNFAEFRIFDMDKRKPELEPLKISLTELQENFQLLEFLIDHNKKKLRVELELSLKAGEIVGKLYDALRSQYVNPDSPESLVSLNKLCVRLVFCLYAESAGIFGKHKIFRDWLGGARNIRQDLILLFDVLNTPKNQRDIYLDDTLKKFPYVNGGLFDGNIEIPNFTSEIKNLLLEEASSGFNWSGISPTIFGAVFESTLNPDTRREGGMHYTSLENIHKVIDPLFLDDLREEFSTIKSRKKLLAFQDKISSLKIFDPACGSGNFLTESFLSLRRLENDILKKLLGEQIHLGELVNPVKVSIAQFFGIEINDFAVAVAQTALWIAELQMIQETRQIIHRDLDFLPLKSYSNIHEGNALHTDWENVCPQPNFIIGNPPFVGKSFQTKTQKADVAKIFSGIAGYGNLDYVACWFKIAADFIEHKKVFCAFVATNSITQGVAVPPLWRYLRKLGVEINFAHQAFKWTSESSELAAVHCVIIGFSTAPIEKPKIIFKEGRKVIANNINAYLLDAPDVIVLPRPTPLSDDVPPMNVGSCPTDGGNFLLSADEYENFIKREPAAKKYIRRYVGSNEFINGIMRYCLWLKDCPPNELRKMPAVMKRVEAVKNFRLASKKLQTRRRAETPTLFAEDRFVDAPALFMPMISSDTRRYIPMGFIDAGIVPSNKALFISNCDVYIFGVLTSSIHMAWMRTVAGRMGMSYSYGTQVVYNTFPFLKPTPAQKKRIEEAAEKILDVRKKYPDATLADLYDELAMPKDLRDAHRENDRAVAAVYGWEKILNDEGAIVTELFKLYDGVLDS